MKVKVLGNWQPSSYDSRTIASEFDAYLREQLSGVTLTNWDIRHPKHFVTSGVYDWHQDNFGENTPTVLWSNVHPTEIRYKGNNKRVNLQPGDVVWFDNQAVEHRAPEAARGSDRWFIRVRTSHKPY